MARIAINDLSVAQESESFLTELNDTDVAMEQINGGLFGFFVRRFFRRRGFTISPNVTVTPTVTTNPTVTTIPRFTFTPTFTFTFGGN
ncbi:hypothetical protein BJP34_35070 [Moorena producens PAL-8-15-08-1]|uniref:Uncharacterized protein n=1 Tax=Moorena producens PAL-8-15-08-1 TaxID=1458985 RepID=A0A1D8U226_9CYAN|nr:hypothetical protein [Moorena producens]AOX03957.1 hypothetical protein BJP34_35070 [Moorena producens PAL-8-15-08-1]